MAASPRNLVAGVLPIWMAAAGATLLALEKATDFAKRLVFFVFFFIFFRSLSGLPTLINAKARRCRNRPPPGMSGL